MPLITIIIFGKLVHCPYVQIGVMRKNSARITGREIKFFMRFVL